MSDRTRPDVVLSQIDVGVVVQDRDARVLFANLTACRLLGVSRPELLSLTSYDPRWQAVTPEGTPVAGADHPVPRAIRSRETVRDVVLGVRRGDAPGRVWLQITAIPTFDGTGEVAAVYCTFTDVSERQIDRNRLHSILEATFQSMSEGVVIVGRDGAVLSANPSAARILGFTLDELTGGRALRPRHVLRRADGSLLPPSEIPSERTRQTGECCRDVRLVVELADGERAWLSVNTDPLAGTDEGAPFSVVATFTDITAQVEANRALEEQRALLRSITEAVPGVLYKHVLGADGRDAFLFVTQRITELVGATPAAILASSEQFWDRVHPDDRQRVREVIVAEARTTREIAARDPDYEQRFDGEFRVQGPDGQWRWVRAQSTGTLVDADVVCHGVITDITERRMLADQLRAAQRQELIGTLVAGVAHNFNNMLAAILPNLDRARNSVAGELRHELNDAHDAAQSAAELVRHLMMLVRRDEPRAAEPVDVVALVQDVMRMCRRTFDQRIAIETTAPTTPLVVLGRRSELQQVILNLCINARDAVEDVPAPVIEVEVVALPDHRVGITVRDTGVGMPPDAQRRVGQPFFTTKAPGKGTGLGLATALGIVREMGGDLTWTSTLGAGTTFEIALPRAPAGETRTVGMATAPKKRFQGQVVLIVDDEPLVRNTLERLLRNIGLTPLVAASGPEGLALLESRNDVAAALVDLSMPEMSGAEVLRRIAAVRPALPVFVVSGWVSDPDALAAARGVIQKPFTTRDLVDALTPVLT